MQTLNSRRLHLAAPVFPMGGTSRTESGNRFRLSASRLFFPKNATANSLLSRNDCGSWPGISLASAPVFSLGGTSRTESGNRSRLSASRLFFPKNGTANSLLLSRNDCGSWPGISVACPTTRPGLITSTVVTTRALHDLDYYILPVHMELATPEIRSLARVYKALLAAAAITCVLLYALAAPGLFLGGVDVALVVLVGNKPLFSIPSLDVIGRGVSMFGILVAIPMVVVFIRLWILNDREIEKLEVQEQP